MGRMVGPGSAGGAQGDDADWPPDLSSWWTPPAFDSLDSAPELQVVVAAHFFRRRPLEHDRNRERAGTKQGKVGELVETKLVRDMEAALGRTAQPFRPWVTEIPVDGQHFWQLGPEHVLLTADLLRDTAQ